MAEGTRFRTTEDKLGAHATKLTGIRDELNQTKEGFTTQLMGVTSKVDDLTIRINKMDLHFEELKQLLLGLQSKPTSSPIIHSTGDASSTITSHKTSTIDEVTTPLPTNFHFIPSSIQSSTIVTPVHTMNTVFTPNCTPIYMSTPHQMHYTPPLTTPITGPYLYTNSTATTAVPLHPLTNRLTVFPSSQPFQTPPLHNQIPNYIHLSHVPPHSPHHQYNTSHPHFNPIPKLEFPKFDGTEPKGWSIKADQYFEFINVEDQRKIKLAAIHLEGKASVWYRFYQSNKPVHNWKCFLVDVINRFENPDQKDVQDLFNKLKQHTTVSDYEDQFEELRALLVSRNKTFSEDYYISSFLSGLKETIKATVRMFRPQTLADAIFIAKQEESKNFKPVLSNPKPLLSRPYTSHDTKPITSVLPISDNKPHSKEFPKSKSTLSPKDILDRRLKGQCFHCDDLYHPGKPCKSKLYLLIGEEDHHQDPKEDNTIIDEMEAVLVNPEAPGEISLNALSGSQSPNTISLQGTIKKQSVNILIDSGSTHSFIDSKLVKRLGHTAEIITPLLVTVADGSQVLVDTACKQLPYSVQHHNFQTDLRLFPLGGSDLVLGVDWLTQHNPFTFDFKQCSLTIHKKSSHVTLQGQTHISSLQSISGKHLSKLLKSPKGMAQGFLCVIQASSIAPVDTLNNKSQNLVHNLLSQYADVFKEPTELPPIRSHDHKIPLLKGSQPINQRGYRVPFIQKTEIEAQVKEMLKTGTIQPSTSSFASPVILVKKKDGSWRMCVDYRKLNDVTVKNKYPIPLIDELLDELKGARWFTKFDLRVGYHQIRVAEEDIYKTAFRTHHGLFEFKVMPFGLSNSPASFQALMNEVFQHQLRKTVLVFFDDILVYSTSLTDHLLHLKEVLQILRDHKLYAKQSKCAFGQQQVEYLGHVISAQGVATDPNKIKAMAEWPLPKTLKQLRSLLGLTGYYRRFIKNYGHLQTFNQSLEERCFSLD